MSKTTRQMSGASLAKYFRELLAAGPDLPADKAASLLRTLQAELAQIRVRLPLPVRKAPVEAGSQPLFDPFAFSTVVVLTKGGAAALLEKLNTIASPDDLRELARAQHIAIPAGADTAGALRAAIIDGTSRRIADRKAAAS